ncbi:zinc-ribbon domain-containing protein [Draconibacterium sp.]|nr:zinc-ribbon domain-containing protein [Draconibacterium sp.]
MFSSTHLGDVMETTCDQCNSRFRLTEDQLRQAYGKVRCSQCGAVFNAMLGLKNFAGELPADYDQEYLPDMDLQAQSHADSDAKSADSADAEIRQRESQTLSLHEAMYGSERRSFFSLAPLSWFIGILLLSALGIAQAIFYQRYQLIEDPRFQQQVITLCGLLPCAEREFTSLEQIRLLERNVFTHPIASNALMVTGSFINQAPFAQRMPDLLISLFDMKGKLIANRRFRPNEYLLQDRNRNVVESQLPIQFRLEIIDPGTDALTYEFEFF